MVAVENGAMRCLKAKEEYEFQCGPDSHSVENRAVETTAAAPRQWAQGTSPMVTDAPNERMPPRGDGETLLGFVHRFDIVQTLAIYRFSPFNGRGYTPVWNLSIPPMNPTPCICMASTTESMLSIVRAELRTMKGRIVRLSSLRGLRKAIRLT